jgi:hypothetical protein
VEGGLAGEIGGGDVDVGVVDEERHGIRAPVLGGAVQRARADRVLAVRVHPGSAAASRVAPSRAAPR